MRLRIIIVFLLSFLPFALRAQRNGYDSILDRFEEICDESISIQKHRSLEERIADLARRTEELKEAFASIDGEMSQEQRARYDAIRRRYELFRLYGIDRPVEASRPNPLPNPLPPPEADQPTAQPGLKVPAVPGKACRTDLFAELQAGFSPFALAVSAGALKGRWGFYLRAASPLHHKKASLSCDTSGMSGGGQVWTSGKSTYNFFSASAGPVFRASQWVALRAGLGYQSHEILWEDINGDWARVEGHGGKGVCLDAGAMLIYRRVFLSAGLTVTGKDTPAPYIGAGLLF